MTGDCQKPDPQLVSNFCGSELLLAKYYLGLRDKIAALNVGVLAFTFSIYGDIEDFRNTYFAFLMLLGFVSALAAYRASLAYNYHFRNYEASVSLSGTTQFDFEEIIRVNRGNYAQEKKGYAQYLSLGTTRIPSHIFWTIFIGSICPMVALFSFWPWQCSLWDLIQL